MSDLAKLYTQNIHRDLKFYYAQWLPTERIEIGTVGTLEGDFWNGKYLFRPLTSLQDLGIPFSPVEDILPDKDPSELDLKSQSGVKFVSKVSGEISTGLPNIPQAKAGIGYEFDQAGGYVLKAQKAFEPRIRDVTKLQRRILRSHEQGHWKKNYAVVYSVLTAEYADMIVSRTASSKIELEVEGDATIGSVELGNAGVQFNIKRESGSLLSMLGSRNVTPLLKLAAIKNKWFAEDEVGAIKANNIDRPQRIGKAKTGSEQLYLDILRYDPVRAQIAANLLNNEAD